MHDTAAHLLDAVIPHVPVRQWVLSLPRWARWLLARDGALASQALAITLRQIFRHHGRAAGRCGAITFVQRFGGALNLNVHFHCVVPDGVFLEDGGFVAAERPSSEDVEEVLRRIARKLERLLRKHRPESAEGLDELGREAAGSVHALPSAAFDPAKQGRLSAFLNGFSLHAGVHLHANDRKGLEQLCSYGARGPFSLERLSQLPDGRLCYRMKRPLPDGSSELFMQPLDFLRKLATLIPPPRLNLVRFHGVFGPNSKWRAAIVSKVAPAQLKEQESTIPAEPAPAQPARNNRLPWAELFKRTFKADVLKCEHCGGPMKVLALINEGKAIREILEHLSLPTTGPPIAKARRAATSDDWA